MKTIYKQLISIVLSISLVYTSVAPSFAHRYLAAPSAKETGLTVDDQYSMRAHPANNAAVDRVSEQLKENISHKNADYSRYRQLIYLIIKFNIVLLLISFTKTGFVRRLLQVLWGYISSFIDYVNGIATVFATTVMPPLCHPFWNVCPYIIWFAAVPFIIYARLMVIRAILKEDLNNKNASDLNISIIFMSSLYYFFASFAYFGIEGRLIKPIATVLGIVFPVISCWLIGINTFHGISYIKLMGNSVLYVDKIFMKMKYLFNNYILLQIPENILAHWNQGILLVLGNTFETNEKHIVPLFVVDSDELKNEYLKELILLNLKFWKDERLAEFHPALPERDNEELEYLINNLETSSSYIVLNENGSVEAFALIEKEGKTSVIKSLVVAPWNKDLMGEYKVYEGIKEQLLVHCANEIIQGIGSTNVKIPTFTTVENVLVQLYDADAPIFTLHTLDKYDVEELIKTERERIAHLLEIYKYKASDSSSLISVEITYAAEKFGRLLFNIIGGVIIVIGFATTFFMFLVGRGEIIIRSAFLTKLSNMCAVPVIFIIGGFFICAIVWYTCIPILKLIIQLLSRVKDHMKVVVNIGQTRIFKKLLEKARNRDVVKDLIKRKDAVSKAEKNDKDSFAAEAKNQTGRVEPPVNAQQETMRSH